MTNLSTALNNAQSGLRAQQAAIATVSHNIANLETEGYSRKLARFENQSYGSLLGGVKFGEVRRAVARELTLSYHQETANLSRSLELNNAFSRLMDTLGRPDLEMSLDARISEVSERFQNLLRTPSESTHRAEAVNAAALLADEIRKVTSDLQALRLESDHYVASGVERANSLISTVNDINTQLTEVQEGQAGYSDLLDRRDETIKELNEIIGVYFFENPNTRAATLYLKTGQLLLNSPTEVNFLFDRSATLMVEDEYERGTHGSSAPNGVYIGRTREQAIEGTHLVTSGSLSGFLEIRDTLLPKYQKRVTSLADSIYTEVNRAHNSGASSELASQIEGRFGIAGNLRTTGSIEDLRQTQIPFARGAFEVVTVTKATGKVDDLVQVNLDALAAWKAENFPQPPATARLQTTQTNVATTTQLFNAAQTGGDVTFTLRNPNSNPANQTAAEITIDFDGILADITGGVAPLDANYRPTVADMVRILNGDYNVTHANGTFNVAGRITTTPALANPVRSAGQYGGPGLARTNVALVDGQLSITSLDPTLSIASTFVPAVAGNNFNLGFVNPNPTAQVAEGSQFLTVGDIMDAINGIGEAATQGITYSTLQTNEKLGVSASLSPDGRLLISTDHPSTAVMINDIPAANPASTLRSFQTNLLLETPLGTQGATSFAAPIADGVDPNLLSFQIVDRDDQALVSEITLNLRDIEAALQGAVDQANNDGDPLTQTVLTVNDLVSIINGATSLTRTTQAGITQQVDINTLLAQFPANSGEAAGAFGGPGLAGAIASIENGELRLTGQSNEYIIRTKTVNNREQVPANLAATFRPPPIAEPVNISQGSNSSYVKGNFFTTSGLPLNNVTEQSFIEPNFVNVNDTVTIAVRDQQTGATVSRVAVNLTALNAAVTSKGDALRYHHIVDALNGYYTDDGVITTQFPAITSQSVAAGYEGGPGLFRAKASFENGSLIIRGESDRYAVEPEANGLAHIRQPEAALNHQTTSVMQFTETFKMEATGEYSPNVPRAGSLNYFFGLNDFFVVSNDYSGRQSISETLNVRSDLLANPNKISHGQLRREDSGQPPVSEFLIFSGDGATAERIVDALSQPVWIDGSTARSTIEYAGDIINEISFAAVAQQSEVTYLEDLHRSIQEQISEVRGVNIDEELQDLIVFQRAYSASARVMSSVQDLLDEVINLVR